MNDKLGIQGWEGYAGGYSDAPGAVLGGPAQRGHLDTRTIEESRMPYPDSSPTPTQRRMLTYCACGGDHKQIILSRIDATEGGCWTWTGALNREGYGVAYHKRSWQAHRLAYIAFRGPIPIGLVIDHLCRNTACVNPDHLEAVTDRENILRGNGTAARNARKTECIRGHSEWSEARQVRVCLVCAREDQAARVKSRQISDDPSDPRHGTVNGYGNLGCRCERCREANTTRHREYMRRRRAQLRQQRQAL